MKLQHDEALALSFAFDHAQTMLVAEIRRIERKHSLRADEKMLWQNKHRDALRLISEFNESMKSQFQIRGY